MTILQTLTIELGMATVVIGVHAIILTTVLGL